jgi:hypothetical protein
MSKGTEFKREAIDAEDTERRMRKRKQAGEGIAWS